MEKDINRNVPNKKINNHIKIQQQEANHNLRKIEQKCGMVQTKMENIPRPKESHSHYYYG